MKTCTKCKIEKPLTEFTKKSSSKDGLRQNCKSCVRDYRNANLDKIISYDRAYKAKNIGRILEQNRAYRAANPERVAEYQKEWRVSNSDRVIEYRKDYYSENRENIKSQVRAYSAANPEKIREHSRNRRARKYKAKGAHTAADVSRIFEHQRGLCANCHARLFKSGKQKFHVDHIVPLAKGGSNWPSNLQCLCPGCNLRKNAKDPIDWAKEQGRLL